MGRGMRRERGTGQREGRRERRSERRGERERERERPDRDRNYVSLGNSGELL